jgi:hypothetical protein
MLLVNPASAESDGKNEHLSQFTSEREEFAAQPINAILWLRAMANITIGQADYGKEWKQQYDYHQGTPFSFRYGDVSRFGTAQKLAGYSGTVPRVHSRGGKTRYGKLRNDVNHYLKWAYSEAGNSIAVNHRRLPNRHVSCLYRRIRSKHGHAKAVGAVARHLAEASFWMLSRNQDYKEPNVQSVSPTEA